jgi:LPS O-antigen subunit length determinant protein (WzzB/FepE family)
MTEHGTKVDVVKTTYSLFQSRVIVVAVVTAAAAAADYSYTQLKREVAAATR